MKKRTKKQVTQCSRWAIFIMAAFALSVSIAEASAVKTLELLVANPEIAELSTLVNSGYLLIK